MSKLLLTAEGMGGSHGLRPPRPAHRRLVEDARAAGTTLLTSALRSATRQIDRFLETHPGDETLTDDAVKIQGQSLLAAAERIEAVLEHIDTDGAYITGFEAIGESSRIDEMVMDQDFEFLIRRGNGVQRSYQIRQHVSTQEEPPIPPHILRLREAHCDGQWRRVPAPAVARRRTRDHEGRSAPRSRPCARERGNARRLRLPVSVFLKMWEDVGDQRSGGRRAALLSAGAWVANRGRGSRRRP